MDCVIHRVPLGRHLGKAMELGASCRAERKMQPRSTFSPFAGQELNLPTGPAWLDLLQGEVGVVRSLIEHQTSCHLAGKAGMISW